MCAKLFHLTDDTQLRMNLLGCSRSHGKLFTLCGSFLRLLLTFLTLVPEGKRTIILFQLAIATRDYRSDALLSDCREDEERSHSTWQHVFM